MRFLIPLLFAPLIAADLTVSPSPFRIEHRFEASVLPSQHQSFSLEPESWTTFKIEALVDHGQSVKKGDVLISFEREDYDRRVADQTRTVATAELALATAELNAAKLKEEHALKLEAAQRAKKAADEDLDYFVKIGRPAAEEDLKQDLKMAEFRLASAKEELKQLKQMYEADDLTEETEEIILERQKFSVAAAEFSLSETQRAINSKQNFGLPRQLAQLKHAATETGIELTKAEQNLPRALRTAELELEGVREQLTRQKLELERLKQDEVLFSWQAPADGIFLHGSLEKHRWELGDLVKSLKLAATAPVEQPLVALVPSDATASLTAWVEPSVIRSLAAQTPVSITVPGYEARRLTGRITTLSTRPSLDGKQSITCAVEWPDDLPTLWTKPVDCIALAYQTDKAIQIPIEALQLDAEANWTVEVKLADGKTERRTVKRGHDSGKLTEILDGLEPGQVVVTPGE